MGSALCGLLPVVPGCSCEAVSPCLLNSCTVPSRLWSSHGALLRFFLLASGLLQSRMSVTLQNGETISV